jgi:hypothetical protein
MSKADGVIYGIKKDNLFYYIGKTSRPNRRTNKDLKVSDATYQYRNDNIRNVIVKDPNKIEIVGLSDVTADVWYDEKLHEVVAKHNENHPLLNADWMKEGKRGFWEGKKRDKHTLHRLSESKFKKIVQYDVDGKFVKIWDSGKDIGIHVFHDYRVNKGSAESDIYRIITNQTIQKRFAKDSYWFKYDELVQNYGGIPVRINIIELFMEQKKIKRVARTQNPRKVFNTYTVILCDKYLNRIKKFGDAEEAAKRLKVTAGAIRKACRTAEPLLNKYLVIYGEKTEKVLKSA